MVAKATQGNYEKTKTYALKSGAGQLNRHMDKYTDDMIMQIKKTCRKGLEFWGYTFNEKDPDNKTAWYKDFPEGEETKEEIDSIYKSYINMNEEALSKLGEPE